MAPTAQVGALLFSFLFSFVLVWTLFYGTPITRIFLCSRWEQSVGFGATQGLCTVRSQHVMRYRVRDNAELRGIETIETLASDHPPNARQFHEWCAIWEKCTRVEKGFWDASLNLL